MDLSNEARLPRGRGKPKAFSNVTQCQEQKGFGWMENDRIQKKRNALLISFRLCRLKFSLETFCLRLWEEEREFETTTGSIPRKIFGQRLVKEWAKGWNVTDCGRGD